MKTAKITNIQGNGTWEGNYGLMYKYDIDLDNGDAGGILSKSQDPYKVGDEINYTIEQKGKFTNIHIEKEKTFNPGHKYQEGPERQRMIVRQSSLNRSTDLAIAGKIELDMILIYAERFSSWVMGDTDTGKLSDVTDNLPF